MDREPIAIIGVGCHFPKAKDKEAFWKLLRDGVDAITEVPAERWDVESFYDSEAATPDKMNTRWGGFLEDLEQFDPHFFKISPREAVSIDPQQRLLLEVAWEALEDAGQTPERLAGTRTGVFMGINGFDYYARLIENPVNLDAYTGSGNTNCMAANRISYFFNLTGPSLGVDTACSSSLVAVHLACQSIWNEESTLALAGGVRIILSPWITLSFAKAGFMAPDGRCKTFDSRANGYVRSEGAGVVVLKPLSQALADRDPIYAVIRGSAVNQDGHSNGLTAPNPRAQEAVLREAYRQAGVSPGKVQYVEAHGTGTKLGDPIEIKALGKVLTENRPAGHYCAVGSVKTNIGHLEVAAGIAGLIKVALSLKYRQIPPSLHFQKPNPYIPFDKLLLRVQKTLEPWPQTEDKAIAGVSSFSFGGTNAHVVLEEAPPEASQKVKDIKQKQQGIERPLHVLTLSAKSEKALSDLAGRYQAFLGDDPTKSLADICFSANTRRSHFEQRLSIITESTVQLQEALDAFTTGKKAATLVSGQSRKSQRPQLAFLFTGQGSQYIGMGRQLYEQAPTFRKTLDLANEILRPDLEKPLLEVLYPSTEESSLLDETAYTQPALFALEYALTELWQSWGIKPSVVIGHSVGEYVAACVAGAFNLEEGLKLIAKRASLMQALPQDGEMVVVFADEVAVRAVIQPYLQEVSIAAINSPRNIVISGVRRAIEAVVAILATEGVETRRLRVSHAFHSPLMEQMLDAFEQQASQIQFQALQIPLISNLTGQIMLPGQILDASYWRSQTRETVKFMAGMNTLFEQGYELFLEIGPKPILSSLGKRCQQEGTANWLSSLTQEKDDWQELLLGLSSLYVQGADINWMAFDEGYLRKVLSLPTYPFQRKRYWLENFSMNGNKLSDKSDESKNNKSSEKENKFEVATPSITKQRDTILFQLRFMVANLLKAEPDEVGLYAPFLEMGADSIVLIDAVRTIENTYGIKITIRQFFEELPNIDALATYINQNLSPEWTIADSQQVESEPEIKAQQQTQPTIAVTPTKPRIYSIRDGEEKETTSETALERIMRQQLEIVSQSMSQVVSQQLEFLHNNGLSTTNLFSSKNGKSQITAQTKTPIVHFSKNNQQKDVTTSYLNSQVKAESEQTPDKASLLSPKQIAESSLVEGLSLQQQRHLEALVTLYNKRTQKSKQRSQAYRPVIADSRSVAGFRLSTKEMVYPIIGERAQGSKFWDVDGNEYVDITMGFGVLLFGHAPSFITKAVQDQMEQGIQIGPQSNLAGEVAQLICELTSMERVTFCNSGTEAVMTALRLARTATGRTKIALFAGSYHGHFDGVLATVPNGQMIAVPMAPGVSQHTVQEVLVLDYGNPESLKILQGCSHELAAVLVEPVQSRQPHLQPKEFLLQLRQLTEAGGAALIFDEVLTGFRIHPGGAQAWFGIQADIATYGKIVGGGMPIGVVAGKATYMNGIDGGLWNYGDASYPQAEKTFFAGTFNKNHVGMAAARAVLKYLKNQGFTLQQQLNQRTSQLAATLNAYFDEENVPIQIIHFGSLFRFTFSGNLDLLFYHLLVKGVYIWEGRNCFLSTAHTHKDIDYVIQAVKDSVEELRSGGFLPKRSVKPPETEKQQEGILGSLTKSSLATNTVPDSMSVNKEHTTEAEAKEAYNVPLTNAQKQLWFLTKMGDDGSLAYNICVSLQLRGSFHLEVMRQAVQKVVNRHDALRTTISSQGDCQHILPSIKVNVPLIDFSSVDTCERDSQVAEWFNKESQSPFELFSESLFRVHILKLEEQLHLMVLNAHHIVVDGWSMGVVMQELAALYSAECQGTVCQLKLPMQFREYIQWQEQQSQTEAMTAHESYWIEKFAQSIPVLDLPTDRPRPPIKTYRGSKQTLRLDTSLCHDIKQFSKKKGVTLFMTLLAVYTILLHRLTGQEDIVVGIPAAGRSLEGSEGLVGYCAHLLPIRSSVVWTTFLEYCTILKGLLLETYEHQDYPFANLIDQLKVGRDASLSPIVTATFNLDRPVAVPKIFGIEMDLFSHPINFAKFDLSLDVIEIDSEFVLNCDYNTDLFDAATIERMLGHFQSLLKEIVVNPEQRVSELPLLTLAQRHQLLVEWNSTQTAYPHTQCIHHWLEAQVQKTPHAVAVVFENQQLTYQELNVRSNQLARHLQVLGVGPEVLVGICVERSLEMVVGLLGILKAGGAYVPLDPAYSKERLDLMLTDAQVSVLLTSEKLVAGLSEYQAQIVCLDADWEIVSQQNEDNPVSGAGAENLAYVIYTSGSTGKPKGVQISHSSVTNFLNSIQQQLELTAKDILLAVTTICFDIAALELYLPLIVGAQVVLTSRDQAVDGTRLLELVNGATVMQATPATWRLLLGSGWKGSHELKILCGGEALPQELANQLLEKGSCLWNLYGPTEATIWSTTYKVAATRLVAGTKDTSVSIGRPIANTQIYILDSHLQPVPIGVPGELHIGGAGLARGYLNRPELTQEKFIPNPFSLEQGARLYKTGDLARYMPDGNIQFLGRLDHQVKVRGFRIEPGEIETILSQHPKVRETVVITRENQVGDKRLVAYVVSQELAPTHTELRRFLKEKLPEYMLPSAFVLLTTLPLTPNGKVDRRALPDPEGLSLELAVDYVMPQTEAELLIAAIWQEVVQLEKVGIHDNFFEMGGHSLLMVQIQNKLQDSFGRELSVVELFKYPTIHVLARYLSQEQSENYSSEQSPDRHEIRSGRQTLRKQQKLLRKKHREDLSFANISENHLENYNPNE